MTGSEHASLESENTTLSLGSQALLLSCLTLPGSLAPGAAGLTRLIKES